MKINNVKNGEVVLIAGGGKIFTDMAAKFVRTEKDIKEIISSDYDAQLVNNILSSGHMAVTEFDYFLFGVQGFARVTETQLVRKRLASYCFKSGRLELNGKREGVYVIPEELNNFRARLTVSSGPLAGAPFSITTEEILELVDSFYNIGVESGIKEENMRYIKPQATEFKGIIGMNAHALMDWFKIRCCKNAQTEIRDMAFKMLKLCKQAAPDLFRNAGPNCISTGFCTENGRQHDECKGLHLTMDEASMLLKNMPSDAMDKLMRSCDINKSDYVLNMNATKECVK